MKFRKNQEPATLYVTPYCFGILLENILDTFRAKHSERALKRVTQLYGFGNYDPTLPNLRSEFEQLSGGFINGKYLYDKSRALQSGQPRIKLNGYYKEVLFRYIGYEDIEAFTLNEIQEEAERKKQLDWIQKSDISPTYYYLSYHFGENKEVIKGQVTVQNGWKNVSYTYIYFQKDGSIKKFEYYGIATKRADILHIKTKTLMGNKMVDGGEDMLYVGHTEPGSSAFMMGTYSAFDIYNKVVAGKLIFEKCNSKEEMIARSLSRKTPAYIMQEIRNRRIINSGDVPNDQMELSPKSPYSLTYEKLPGTYTFVFLQGELNLGTFAFSIDSQTFKLHPLTEGVVIKRDHFDIIQNGSVIHFSFQITGIAPFSYLEVFVKTYYLHKEEKETKGVFSGLDIENRLVCGEVGISFST